MTKPEDLARLRERLQLADSRRLTFLAWANTALPLPVAVQQLGGKGYELAVVNLAADNYVDRDLGAAMWRQHIVGSVDPNAALGPQLLRAGFVGVPALLFELPEHFDRLAMRDIAAYVARTEGQVWLQVPWSDEGWHRFDEARRFFAHHPRVHVALDVREAPPAEAVVSRWCAEAVELIRTGDDPWPALQPLFRSVAERVFVASDESRFALQALHKNAWADVPERERHAAGFAKNAIVPVEPLGDDIKSETYELIESDDIKYRGYRAALEVVLRDREDGVFVVVVGAGRGGLVDEVLGAAKMVGRSIDLVALEKNPGAIATLEGRNKREWGGVVRVIDADMRIWSPSRPIDVVVSELLGGFGDNELSPECLAPLERHLHPNAVMVPADYTSWLAPVSSAPLYMAIANREQLHTVQLDRAILMAPTQACFAFRHPLGGEFEQTQTLDFPIASTGVVHGFAGFFETTLAEGVTLSIRPETKTPKMRSWSPMLFPLREPLAVAAGDRIQVTFFRRESRTHVWYEWVVIEPTIGPLHNAGGRAYAMRR